MVTCARSFRHRNPRSRWRSVCPRADDPTVGRSSSGSISSLEFVSLAMGIGHHVRPMLSWGSCLFRALHHPDLGCDVCRPSSHELALYRLRSGLTTATLTTQPALRSFTRSGGGVPALAATSALLRFPTSSSFSPIRAVRCSGSWFRLGHRRVSPRSGTPDSSSSVGSCRSPVRSQCRLRSPLPAFRPSLRVTVGTRWLRASPKVPPVCSGNRDRPSPDVRIACRPALMELRPPSASC